MNIFVEMLYEIDAKSEVLLIKKVSYPLNDFDFRVLRSEDKIAHLKFEEERLSKQFNEEAEEISRLELLIGRLQTIQKECTSNVSVFAQLTEQMCEMKKQFQSEFVLYDLHNLTIALVFPKVRLA